MRAVIPYEALVDKRIRKEAVREAMQLYRLTAGFTEPEPPEEEARRLWEEGLVEL
jgi:hypothetical protein